ncbi:MFS transporter [Paraburkholderia sp. BCC1886]|uniref:MFS transporter n=1 Tax=Paraburkholderia sp. BCC1886 TaxID=2562670 RepID=UPI001183E242|nr:MFS transporter [Paraburkholderia sp. BCC1886]
MNKLAEFRRGWLQLTGSTLGLGIGVIGLGSYNLGLFAKDLQGAVGLTKTQYGAGYLAFTLGLALGLQMWGRLLSRFGAARTAAGSALALAVCFVGMAGLISTPTAYIALVGMAGFFGGGTSGLTFTRIVSGWFDRGRGFALGLTQVGLGLCGAILPPIVAATIGKNGWHSGYLLLAAIAAVGAPISLLILRDSQDIPRTAPVASEPVNQEELAREFAAVKRTGTFWLMCLAFTLSTLFVAGNAQHMAPMLRELGATATSAAKYMSLLGIGTVCVRLIVGWLSDYVHSPRLMAFSCLVGMGGVITLKLGGVGYAPLYAFTVGWTFGGEIDLVALMCTRYFGLRVFARAYAFQYGALCIAAGVGPLGLGWLADRLGSYQPGLLLSAALAAAAAFVFLLLPRYDAGATEKASTQGPIRLNSTE